MKNPLLSKTNWVQAVFLGLLCAEVAMPELQGALCKDGKLVMGAQILLTLLARNVSSNISVKPGDKQDKT